MNKSTIDDCRIIPLEQIQFRAGNITPVSNDKEIPFKVARVFYIYDIPGGKDRGAHAHRECHQFIVAAGGSFEVEMDDGVNKKRVFLNRPYSGLYIPPGIWAAEKEFSSGAICLVLTSHPFDAADYIREYSEFINYKNI